MQSHVVQADIASKIRKLLLITTPSVENDIFVVDLTRPIMHVQRRGKYVHSARSQTISQGSVAATNVNIIDEETESFREAVDDQETIFLYAIDKGSGKDEALVPLTLNNQLSVNFKIDTGAQANVIPKNIFDKLDRKPNLQPTNHQLTNFCGARIPVIGTFDLTCSHK